VGVKAMERDTEDIEALKRALIGVKGLREEPLYFLMLSRRNI
jgi:hypothetical protein